MSEKVAALTALSKVGVERHPTAHWAKAVSDEQTVYILHSRECLLEYEDLRECPYSLALDNGIDINEWTEDEATEVVIGDGHLLPKEPR